MQAGLEEMILEVILCFVWWIGVGILPELCRDKYSVIHFSLVRAKKPGVEPWPRHSLVSYLFS